MDNKQKESIIRGMKFQNLNNEGANVYVFITDENCPYLQRAIDRLHINRKDKIQLEVINMIINRLHGMVEEIR